jgi:hypothetical protein
MADSQNGSNTKGSGGVVAGIVVALVVVVVVIVVVVVMSSKTTPWGSLEPSATPPSSNSPAPAPSPWGTQGPSSNDSPSPAPAPLGSPGCCILLDGKTPPFVAQSESVCNQALGWFDATNKTCTPLGCCCTSGNSLANVTEGYCKYWAATGSNAYTFTASDPTCAQASDYCTIGCCCSKGNGTPSTQQACSKTKGSTFAAGDSDCSTVNDFCALGCCCANNQIIQNQTKPQCDAQQGSWMQGDPTVCAAAKRTCLLGCCCDSTSGTSTPNVTQPECSGQGQNWLDSDPSCSLASTNCALGCCCIAPGTKINPGVQWTTQPNVTQSQCVNDMDGTFVPGDDQCMSTDLTCIKGCCCDASTGKTSKNVTQAQCSGKGQTWNQQDPTCTQAGTACTLGCCCIKGKGRQTSNDTCKGMKGKWSKGACSQTTCPTPQTWACTGATQSQAGACTLQTDGNGEYASAQTCAYGCASATNPNAMQYYVVNNNIQYVNDALTIAPQSDPQNVIFSLAPNNGGSNPVSMSVLPGTAAWYEGAVMCAYDPDGATPTTPMGQCATLPNITDINTIQVTQGGDVQVSLN